MNQTQFKNFKKEIQESNVNSDIYYMGFLFLQLTEKQVSTTCDIFDTLPFIKTEIVNGIKKYHTPSGLVLWRA